MAMNMVVLGGNVIKDPEIKAVGEHKTVKFTLAVNRPYKKNDEYVSDFFDVDAWDRTAEYISKYVSKGTPVTVRGRIEIDVSEKDGNTRRFTHIRCEEIDIHGKRNSGEAKPAAKQEPKVEARVEVSSSDDDLPF